MNHVLVFLLTLLLLVRENESRNVTGGYWSTTKFVVYPQNIQNFLDLYEELWWQTREDNRGDILQFDLLRGTTNEYLFLSVERYTSLEAYRTYKSQPWVEKTLMNITALDSASLIQDYELVQEPNFPFPKSVPFSPSDDLSYALQITIKQGLREEFLEKFLGVSRSTYQEGPGIIQYDLLQDLVDPYKVNLLQRYASAEALASHMNQDYVVDFLSNISTYASSVLNTTYVVVEFGDNDAGLTPGQIAGIVIGCSFLAIILVGVVILILGKNKDDDYRQM